ncbi:MAG: YhdX family protein [Bacillota bacterium]
MGKGRIRVEESIKVETDKEINEAKLLDDKEKDKE